jgi:amidophosphoribosyltransferase
MCGIVVGLAFGKLRQRDEAMRQRLLRYFTTELLLATEDRGKDATGAAVLFNDGNYMGVKRGDKVSAFLSTFGESKDCYGSLLKVWRDHPERGRIYLGHCRAGTTGDKEDNENNHPIKVGNLVGIHNGVIKNHLTIFDKLGCKRDGKVDSEAIFRLFEYFTRGGKEPFTLDMLQEIVNRLEGQFAVTLFNADNMEQVPIFRDGRPVEFVLIRRYGILLMLSESKFWNRVYFRYERMVNYYNELNSVALPSFLNDDDEIVTATMPDDTAIIFDLSKKVTKDAKIRDLGESRKMIRNDKIWQIKTVSYTANRATGYNQNWNKNKRTGTDTVSKDGDKKRRIFDKITNQYKIKVGDKELSDEEATTLAVDADDNSTDNKETKATETATETTAEDTKSPATGTDTEDNTGSDDDGKEDDTSVKVEVKDMTTYDTDKNERENKGESDDDVIDIEPKDVKVIKSTSVSDIVEVDMTTYPPEIVEAANSAYDEIPSSAKGCADLDELLDALDIQDKDKATELGPLLVGNRAMKHGWLQGYMHAMKLSPDIERVKEKSKQRERHIAGLKSLVLLLAKFYEDSKVKVPEDSALNIAVKKRLAKAAASTNRKLDIDEVSRVFNSHEKKSLEDISTVVSEAESALED